MAAASLTPYQNLLVEIAPRPIRTKTQYRKAVRQLERLMVPHPGRAQGEMIELLATLVEQYEASEYPTPKLPPDVALRELIEAREITQAELAAATGISKQTVSNIVKGRRGISKVNALKLAAFFRAPLETFFDTTSIRAFSETM